MGVKGNVFKVGGAPGRFGVHKDSPAIRICSVARRCRNFSFSISKSQIMHCRDAMHRWRSVSFRNVSAISSGPAGIAEGSVQLLCITSPKRNAIRELLLVPCPPDRRQRYMGQMDLL